MLTVGKIRHLQQISNSRGIFTILAVDHRDPLLQTLEQRDGKKPSWEQVVVEKQRLVKTLAPYTSGMLLDPIYSLGPAIIEHVIPKDVGLLVAREKSGYLCNGDNTRGTSLLPDWDAKATKQVGAAAVKLLLYYHPQADNASNQEKIVRQIAKECSQSDILFMLEPISYPLEDMPESEFAKERPKIVLESAQKLVPLGVDILKAEFPCHMHYEADEKKMRNYCRKLTDTIDIPWVLLSAGVDFFMFKRQVEMACEEGASGFVAGRAIWKEALALQQKNQRDHYLHKIAISRLEILSAIANHFGCPWKNRLTSLFPIVQKDWHSNYYNH